MPPERPVGLPPALDLVGGEQCLAGPLTTLPIGATQGELRCDRRILMNDQYAKTLFMRGVVMPVIRDFCRDLRRLLAERLVITGLLTNDQVFGKKARKSPAR